MGRGAAQPLAGGRHAGATVDRGALGRALRRPAQRGGLHRTGHGSRCHREGVEGGAPELHREPKGNEGMGGPARSVPAVAGDH